MNKELENKEGVKRMLLKELFEGINKEISKEKHEVTQTEWYDEFLYQFEDFADFADNNKVNIKEVEKSEVDEHRWYGTQFIVWEIECNDEKVYIGARVVTQSYSEMQSIRDIDWRVNKLTFMQPKEVTTTIYEEIE